MMAGSKIFAYLSYMSYCCFRHSSVSGCIKERLASEASWFYFLFNLPVFVKFILECFDSILIHLSQIIHDNFPFLFKCFSNCWLLWDDFHYVNHFLYAVSQGCKILIQFRAPTCCNRWSNFQSSSESSLGIHCFYYISLYNWSRKVAPLYRPIKCKTTTTVARALTFPAL